MKTALALVPSMVILFAASTFADEVDESTPLYDPNTIVSLINDPRVKKELRIAPYQEAAIKAACDRWKSRSLSDGDAIGKMTEPDREAKIRALVMRRANEVFQSLGLSASQLKRFKQILLQQWGILIFNFPEIRQAMAIDEDLADRIEEERDELYEEIFERVGETNRQAEATRLIIQISKSIHPRIRALFTDAQLRVLDELIGTRYHFVIK